MVSPADRPTGLVARPRTCPVTRVHRGDPDLRAPTATRVERQQEVYSKAAAASRSARTTVSGSYGAAGPGR